MAHRAALAENPSLREALLPQRRGPERRVRRAPVGLSLLDRPHCEVRGRQAVGEAPGGLRRPGAGCQRSSALPVGAKSRPCATRRPSTDTRVAGKEDTSGLTACWAAGSSRTEPPDPSTGPRGMCDALPFPVHHQPDGHRLHPARRQLRHDLLPQHRRDLVSVQPVEHPAGLVSLDQAIVHFPRVRPRPGRSPRA